MIPLSTIRVLDYCAIGVSGTSFLLCTCGALYIVPWTKARRAVRAAHNFTLFWKVRLLLQLLGAAWALVQWLILAALWAPASPIFPAHVSDWTRNGALCRVYLCVSIGVLEPLFLLCALLLCSTALSTETKQGLWPNAWLLTLALLAALPVIVGQCIIAWIETLFPNRNWDVRADAFPHYMLAAYFVGSPQLCDSGGSRGCALCMFPAASCILSVAFAGLWLAASWRVLSRMGAAVINRRLKARLRLFRWSVFALVTVGGATRCATLAGSPFTVTFQLLWFLHFLTIPALLTVVLLVLVILPMHDAYAVDKPLPVDVAELPKEEELKLELELQLA